MMDAGKKYDLDRIRAMIMNGENVRSIQVKCGKPPQKFIMKLSYNLFPELRVMSTEELRTFREMLWEKSLSEYVGEGEKAKA
jgi:hypothetical protein